MRSLLLPALLLLLLPTRVRPHGCDNSARLRGGNSEQRCTPRCSAATNPLTLCCCLDGISQGEKAFMYVLAFTGFIFVLCVPALELGSASAHPPLSQVDEARGGERNATQSHETPARD